MLPNVIFPAPLGEVAALLGEGTVVCIHTIPFTPETRLTS